MPENFVYVRILQMQGDARSDANEANDMQKLVFVYLSRRASHLYKPGMTMEGARVVPLFKTPAKRAVLTQRVTQFVLLEAFSQILGEGAF